MPAPTPPPRYIGPDHERDFGGTVRARVHGFFKETGRGTKADARLIPKVVLLMALFLGPLVLMLLHELLA